MINCYSSRKRMLLVVSILLFFAFESTAQVISSYMAGIGDNSAPATNAKITMPLAITHDNMGNIYVATQHRIRKINLSTGYINTIIGSSVPSYELATGPALYARLVDIHDIESDAAGNLYISYGYYIIKVDIAGNVTHIAGNGTYTYSGDGSLAAGAGVTAKGITIDGAGNIYLAEFRRIRKISTSGIITTVAGTGGDGYSGDGGPALSAQLSFASDVAVDNAGNLLIIDQSNSRIRKVTPSGIITTIAGDPLGSSTGEGIPALSAQIKAYSIVTDASGNFFITETQGQRIRKINPSGIINTVVGNGSFGYSGDGGLATAAKLYDPTSTTITSSGDMYIADSYYGRIRKVSSGTITTIGGNGGGSYADGVSGNAVALLQPSSICRDVSGNLYFVHSNVIRKINPLGVVSTIAGDGLTGYSGDGGPATLARFTQPNGLSPDRFGNLYISDIGSHHVRKINSSGTITTVAGGGVSGLGDGGPATSAMVLPNDVATDSTGNIYIVESANNRVRKIDASTGTINTIAGNGSVGYTGDGGPATSATLNRPVAITVDGREIYIYR